MANEIAEMMAKLGFSKFEIVGQDRGARVRGSDLNVGRRPALRQTPPFNN
jgi:hypothetical protein